jgi:glutamine synthetase
MPTTASEVARVLKQEQVRFLRLQFTDIMGVNKNVEVPESQFAKALDGQTMFDGSSIKGFARIEESDMLLKPDLETFRVFPWEEDGRGKVARVVCDIAYPDDRPFEGDPRSILKRQIDRAAKRGLNMMSGPEAEFFLFYRSPEGAPTTYTHDKAAYFDLEPVDAGEDARRDIVNALVAMGFEVEAAHHEVAPGQHEIDFKYADALTTADNVATFKYVVRKVALDHNLHATFMPKPIAGINGSGMHTHMSLFKGEANAFYDERDPLQLSSVAYSFVAGLLEHAPGFVAVTNPLVNSYKRLVPGYEAPTNVAWSAANRSAMIRIPARRGIGTRAELRMIDPSCNPYLAATVCLASGMDGIERGLKPPPPVNKNIFEMTVREKRRHRVRELPGTLRLALDALERDQVITDALGPHLIDSFLTAKRQEWQEYVATVHQWELDRYLATY